MTVLSDPKRNPLTADSDPTDEELALVMREALDFAMARKLESDAWMRREQATLVLRVNSGIIVNQYCAVPE